MSFIIIEGGKGQKLFLKWRLVSRSTGTEKGAHFYNKYFERNF